MPFNDLYRRQVALLIRIIPFVAHETNFALKGGTAINPVIYAEVAATFDSQEALSAYMRPLKVQNTPFSETASFLAGQAFWAYRQRKGAKTGVLPDFFIGAQAQAEGWTLLTRDVARYRTYFPSVKLICPEQ